MHAKIWVLETGLTVNIARIKSPLLDGIHVFPLSLETKTPSPSVPARIEPLGRKLKEKEDMSSG
jgi:hypothetical protein